MEQSLFRPYWACPICDKPLGAQMPNQRTGEAFCKTHGWVRPVMIDPVKITPSFVKSFA